MIKGFNHMHATMSVELKKGATIKSQTIQNGSTVVNGTAAEFPLSEDDTFIFSVTDSFGNTISEEVIIPMINYVTLSCNLVTNRPTADGDMTFKFKGNYFNGDFGKNANDVNAFAASVLFAADRFASYTEKWKNDYLDGTLIFSDRYTPANALYQMTKLEPEEWDSYLEWLFDFEYNKIARNKYIGKKSNAFGIEKILYKCPDCDSEYNLYTEDDKIICKHCGLKIKVNEYYDLEGINCNKLPIDIDKWYKWQRRCVVDEIKDDNFELILDGVLATLKLDRIRKEPKNRQILSIGTATLNKQGLVFEGALNEETIKFNFNAKSLYSLTLSTKGYLEFYYNNEYYLLIPNNPNQCLIKWTLASEEIHNLYDEKWRSACADVYEYNKGDIYE